MSERKRKVYIVGASREYEELFLSHGWEVVNSLQECDLVQFTGGADVSPALYNELPHRLTGNNPERDKRESLIYFAALNNNIPMAGICRGGQFLNVMCGGAMWQHVTQHAIGGTHTAKDVFTGDEFQVTSTHHQMMRPGDKAVVIVTASICKQKQGMNDDGSVKTVVPGTGDPDIEVVFYPKDRCLCFQPHPEFPGYADLAKRYMDYINLYLFTN